MLSFYAAVADWQSENIDRIVRFEDLGERFGSLIELVARTGTDTLADAGKTISAGDLTRLARQYWESPGPVTPPQFFVRVLMQLYACRLPEGMDCPWCVAPPQVGCLRTEGDGQALELVCGLCFRRRIAPRGICPRCRESDAEKLLTFSTDAYTYLKAWACQQCRGYLILVDLESEAEAIPEVDELAAVALDLWVVDRGYQKLQPNIVGV